MSGVKEARSFGHSPTSVPNWPIHQANLKSQMPESGMNDFYILYPILLFSPYVNNS